MKKILIQFWNWIAKYRKRLVYGAIVLFIGQICIFGIKWIWIENQVFAEAVVWTDPQPQSQDQERLAAERNDKISFFEKLIYSLLYPLLAVAWKLVDNSFVYWEIFGFDAVLWNLWNIVRNLANYSLWFFIVYKIFKYLIDWKEKVKDLLLKALIAWVWIQASRFLMGALIDVSTILTYAVWGLPISMLGEGDWNSGDIKLEQDPYMLKTLVYLDVDDLSTFSVYLTNVKTGWEYGDVYISECETVKCGSEEVILAPKKIYYADEKDITHTTEKNRCHLYGQVYMFNNLYNWINFENCTDKNDCTRRQIDYKSSLETAKTQIINWGEGITDQIGTTLLKIWQTWDSLWLDEYNKNTWETWPTIKLGNILNGKSYVGVFTALYSSLINTVGIMPKNTWIFWDLLWAALSLGHMIAISIPLLVTIVVFMMRIWVLWVAIALSPFIVFLTAFGLMKDAKNSVKSLEYLSLENLIPIIFTPAIICFAISLSAVLVSIINNLNIIPIWTSKDEILWWLVKLDIAGTFIPIGKMIIAILWVAVTRFLVWAAVESSKLWKSWIAKSLKDLAQNAILSMPIVPIPTKDGKSQMVGLEALKSNGWIISNIAGQIKREYSRNGDAAVEEFLYGKEKESEAYNNRIGAYKNALVGLDASQIGNDWTTQEIMIWDKGNKMPMTFSKIGDDSSKKTIIDAINGIGDENKRATFGRKPSVTIWNDVYKFVGTMKDKTGKQVTINKYLTDTEKQKLANDNGYI